MGFHKKVSHAGLEQQKRELLFWAELSLNTTPLTVVKSISRDLVLQHGGRRRCWDRREGHMICVYTFSICRIFDAAVKGLKWKARAPRSHCSTGLRASGTHEDFQIIFACLLLLSGLQAQSCIQPLRSLNLIKLNVIYDHYRLLNLNFSNQNKEIIPGNHLKGLTASNEHVLWILARFVRHLCNYGLSLHMPNICRSIKK